MAVDLGSTFKELIDEINSKGSGSDYVKLTTDQTISGIKTFTSGSIVASKTDSSNKTMKVAYGCNGIAYTPYGTTSIKLISFPAKDGTFALTSDIPNLTNYVTVNTAQTITGVKTFNAPTNVSGKETITTKFKTSNGGALIIGKEGANSGTMLRFDQVDGTCRLRFRSSATAGAMVWEQPEKNAALYFDMGNSTGSGKNRVTLRNVEGTLALTKEIPAAVSANPTLSGSETELTGLQIGSAKYKIPTDYVKLSGSQTINGVKAFGNLSQFKAGIDLYGTLSIYESINSFAKRTDYKYNVITSYVPKNNTTNTYTSYKISFPTSVDSATAINLPTKDGTLATQEYVTEQIGNINTLLATLNNGTGV